MMWNQQVNLTTFWY